MAIYAVADNVPKDCNYLTAGKPYEVLCEWDSPIPETTGLTIFDDFGNALEVLWEACIHLNGGSWRRVEK